MWTIQYSKGPYPRPILRPCGGSRGFVAGLVGLRVLTGGPAEPADKKGPKAFTVVFEQNRVVQLRCGHTHVFTHAYTMFLIVFLF